MGNRSRPDPAAIRARSFGFDIRREFSRVGLAPGVRRREREAMSTSDPINGDPIHGDDPMVDARDVALSVVVPAYNEAGNIGPLLAELEAAFAGEAVEIVVVDDASADGTGPETAGVGETARPPIRLLTHARRAGKSRALLTGFQAARGAWIATIDGDGQNDPADLRRIWEHAKAGPADALYAGVRAKRNDGAVKKATSRVANFIRRRMLRDDCRDTGCGVKMMPTALVRALPYFDNMHRFLPALARRAGLRVVEVEIDDRPRRHGVSKYGFFDRAAVAAMDLFGVYWLIRRYSDPGDVREGSETSRSNR